MTADDPYNLPLRTLAAALRHGELSSEAVTRAFLERIEAVNPKLNAVVQIRPDAALSESRAVDRLPADRRGPLHGCTITTKAPLTTAGISPTGGTRGRAESVPSQDATGVRRLREAGAITMGK